MSEATAIHTLGRSEIFQCTTCTLLFQSGTDMEITASPEGWVEILCPSCVEKRDADEEAVTAVAENLYGPAPDLISPDLAGAIDSVHGTTGEPCICGHDLQWHGHTGCRIDGCDCEMYEEKEKKSALDYPEIHKSGGVK